MIASDCLPHQVGERAELEAQLRALHRKMRQSSLLLAPPTSPGAHHGASAVPSPGGSLPGAHHGATPTDASAVASAEMSAGVCAAAADGVGARRALNLGPNLGGMRVVASTASSPPRTYVPSSPPRTAATGARDDAPSPRTALAAERSDKEQALALRTRAVRDLKACRDALAKANGRLDETQRLLAQANGRLDETQRLLGVAKLLLHSRSRFGRPAQLLRMLGALRDWAAATRGAPW